MRFDYFEHIDGPQGRHDVTGRMIPGKGGGGGGSPYYANQDKLFGTQADISENLYNQYASLAPTYLENTQNMVDEAMDGTLSTRARNQAGADASQALSQGINATNRNMAKFGAEFNPSRMAAMGNSVAVGGAAMKANAMNKASQWAEDQKWNRNAGAYGQISGMGTGAMQGMGSAGAGYGGMAAQANSSSMANAAGWGKFGATMAGGSLSGYGWAKGGEVDSKNLPEPKFAAGAYVRKPFQNHLKQVDWRSMPTAGTGSVGGSFSDTISALAPAATLLVARDMLGEKKNPGSSVVIGGVKDSAKWISDKVSGASVKPETSTTSVESDPRTVSKTEFMKSAQPVPSYEEAVPQMQYDIASDGAASAFQSDPWANAFSGAGYADGGYAQQIDNGNYASDPDKFRGKPLTGVQQFGARLGASAQGTFMNPMTYLNGYNKVQKLEAEAAKQKSLIPSNAETQGVAQTSPVADAPAVESSDLPPQVESTTAGDQAEFSRAFNVDEVPASADTASVDTGVSVDGAESTVADQGVAATDAASGVANAGAATDAAGAATDATSAAADAGTAADAASNASGSAGSVGGAASVVKGALDIANGRDAGEAIADAGAGYAGAYTGAQVGSALGPVGTVVGGVLGGIVGGSFFADGGDIERDDYRPGGDVEGPGTETSDDIPAWLSDGEVVENADAVKLHPEETKQVIDEWNQSGGDTKDLLLAINDKGLEKREGKQNRLACGGVAKHGLKFAGGGFLGGNLGVALGAGVDQYNQQQGIQQRQQMIDLQKENNERIAEEFQWKKRDQEDATALKNSLKDVAHKYQTIGNVDDYIKKNNEDAEKAAVEAGTTAAPLTPEQEAVIRGSVSKGQDAEFSDAFSKFAQFDKAEAMSAIGRQKKLLAALQANPNMSVDDKAKAFSAADPIRGIPLEMQAQLRSDAIEERKAARIANEQYRREVAQARMLMQASGRGGSGGSGGEGSGRASGASDSATGALSREKFNKEMGFKDEDAEVADKAHSFYLNLHNGLNPAQRQSEIAQAEIKRLARQLATGKSAPVVDFNPKTMGFGYALQDENGGKYWMGSNGQNVDPRTKDTTTKQPFYDDKVIAEKQRAGLVMLAQSDKKAYDQAKQLASNPEMFNNFNRSYAAGQLNDPSMLQVYNAARIIRELGDGQTAPSKKDVPESAPWYAGDYPTNLTNDEGTPNAVANTVNSARNWFAKQARKASGTDWGADRQW